MYSRSVEADRVATRRAIDDAEQVLARYRRAVERQSRNRVLIVDSHPGWCLLMRQLVDATGYLEVAGEAHSAEQAKDWLASNGVDLVVTELALPDDSGAGFIQWVQARRPESQVLIVTGVSSPHALKTTMQLGVAGYIVKTAHPDAITRAVADVIVGAPAFDPDLCREIVADTTPRLTAREAETLALLSRGLRNRDIAAELTITSDTVEYFIRQIKGKLGASSRLDIVNKARVKGLLSNL